MTVQRKKWKRNWATFNVDSSRPLSLVITSQQFLHFPRNSLLSAKSKKRIIFPLTGRRVAILCRSVQGAHNFAMINGREEAWAERTVKLGPVDRKGRGGRPRRQSCVRRRWLDLGRKIIAFGTLSCKLTMCRQGSGKQTKRFESDRFDCVTDGTGLITSKPTERIVMPSLRLDYSATDWLLHLLMRKGRPSHRVSSDDDMFILH